MFRRPLFFLFALTLALAAAGVSALPTAAQSYCMSVSSRLYIGAQGVVTPGLPNVLRAQPAQGTGGILAYIPAGGIFTVLSGPTCNNGITWWEVNYSGVSGWTPEGQWSTYWTEPVYTPTPAPTSTVCDLRPRLAPGMTAHVTPGLPNRVRSSPGYNGRVLGYIPERGSFTVLSQPAWVTGTYWYQVNYNGLVGWTAEGSGCTYWLEPG